MPMLLRNATRSISRWLATARCTTTVGSLPLLRPRRYGSWRPARCPTFWMVTSGIFKAIGVCLLILGLLLAAAANASKWRKRFGYGLLLVAALGLAVSFATDIFQVGRGRPAFVYNFLDMERFRWEGLSSLGEGKH